MTDPIYVWRGNGTRIHILPKPHANATLCGLRGGCVEVWGLEEGQMYCRTCQAAAQRQRTQKDD